MNGVTELNVTLQPDAVVAPAQRAIQESVETVDFCLGAIEKADLKKAPEGSGTGFGMRFSGPEISEAERKTQHSNWVLSKGFQELSRGIRAMLEEAYLYNCVLDHAKKYPSKPET